MRRLYFLAAILGAFLMPSCFCGPADVEVGDENDADDACDRDCFERQYEDEKVCQGSLNECADVCGNYDIPCRDDCLLDIQACRGEEHDRFDACIEDCASCTAANRRCAAGCDGNAECAAHCDSASLSCLGWDDFCFAECEAFWYGCLYNSGLNRVRGEGCELERQDCERRCMN